MTDEHKMLQNSAERYLRENYDFAARQHSIDRGNAIDAEHWRAFSDMGWTAMTIPEAADGFGFGLADIAPVIELFGYYLVREPLLESALLAGELIAAASEAHQTRYLPGIIDGSVIATVAQQDATPLTRQGKASGQRLQGDLQFVPSGGIASHVLAPLRHDNQPHWVMLDLSLEGISRERYQSHDGRQGAHITIDLPFDDSCVLVSGIQAEVATQALYQRAMLIGAAEGVGIMQGALDLTVEYTRQREQFGQALASFQALQHRMADMLIQTELARSLVLAACHAWDNQADNTSTLALAAKAKVDAAARTVTQEAIQMHGGIATTNEYKVGHYFKRMALLESWPQHRDALIAQLIQNRQASITP